MYSNNRPNSLYNVITNNGSSRNDCLGSSSKTSSSIPIRHAIVRTDSEIQLCEDEQMADMCDYHMYVRIVYGMQQQHSSSGSDSSGISPTLHNIIRTRNSPVDGDDEVKSTNYLPGFQRSATRLNEWDSMAEEMFMIEDAPPTFDSSMSSMDSYDEDCGIFDMDDM
mmetsp:Transcript_16672/g.23171  ORF Transcript_16672/g.23171 Transcript_16672/m.23171 type:complete len:166 (+) Transcript_16672:115-612(+)